MRYHRIPGYRTALRSSVLALACTLVGCVSDGQGPSASVSDAGSTIAFESIDGPPPPVFDRMVGMLDTEARLRHVTVVSRKAPAAFRVRSYLAAQMQGERTTIAWVWDVYDRDGKRALRLGGEEPATAGGNAWAAADDVVLRRIAQAGLSGLGSALNGAAPAASPPGLAVASAEDLPASEALSPNDAGALGFAAR